MSQTEYENLSALMDGELESHQLRFMLRRMDANTTLRATWERYHVVGDSLRREVHDLADPDLASRIMHEIGTPATQSRHGSHRWLRWSAGGAIAAGVAVAALVAVQPQMRGTSTLTAAAPASSSPSVAAAGLAATPSANEPMNAPTVPRWLSASPAAAQLAQPAAATFSPSGRFLGLSESSGYYSPGLAPYMTIPHAHGLGTRDNTRASNHGWWSVTQQPTQQQWRLQAQ